MPASLKIVAVHGIGNHQDDLSWQPRWRDAILKSVQMQNQAAGIEIEFVMHDQVFDEVEDVEWTAAFGQLLGSWFWNGLRDRVNQRGVFDRLSQFRRYYAGMVAKWVSNEPLRKKLRGLVWDAIKDKKPDVLLGHSLGSLVSYDLLQHVKSASERELVKNLTFLSIGSQIGHPSVRSVYGGYLMMPPVKRWFHVYNPADQVFTTPIAVSDDKFQQVVIRQNVPEATSEHDAVGYLADDETAIIWRALAAPQRAATRTLRVLEGTTRALRTPKHRALIVGINKYGGNAVSDLSGCVNDAYLMSAALQETGFDASEIRLLLDERATADGIRERIGWLLEDVGPGDVRILHYSGHGAQIPAYGWKDEVDHIDECLCPHDFDWSLERAITDDWLHQTYTQLPYDSYFLAILDCCHSGGLARGGISVRGLTPPDDIRHRMLQWNAVAGVWEPRKLDNVSPAFAAREEFTGETGSVYRLGRAIPLRQMTAAEFSRSTKEYGHKGPYLPVLFEACAEAELAEEYLAGSQSYGVFTYAIVKSLRMARAGRESLSFQELFDRAVREVANMGHAQNPQVAGPTAVLKEEVPLSLAQAVPRATAGRKPPVTGRPRPVKKPVKKTARKKTPRKKTARKRAKA
jgi:hypothetical protein